MTGKDTKKSLAMSAISMLVCVVMLAGLTFAWFTDSVTNKGNRIQAGNLKIDLLMDKDGAGGGGYVSIASGTGDIFSENGNGANWEPGKTEIVYLAVKNKGNLALNYNILLNVKDGGLANALEYAVLDGKKAADLGGISSWTELKELSDGQTGDVKPGEVTAAPNGTLDEIIKGTKNETQYFALAVHMKESVGNEYAGGSITIDVNVVAKQAMAEEDSFGNTYDENATFPPAFSAGTEDELKTAFADAKDGDVIAVTKDINVSQRIDVKSDVTIDLGENTLTSSRNEPFKIAGDGSNETNVTIKATTGGIKVSGQSNECFYIGDTKKVPVNITIDGGIYESKNSEFFEIWDYTPANITIRNVKYSGYRAISHSSSGTAVNIDVIDSNLHVEDGYSAVYCSGSVVCNMKNVNLTTAGSVRGFCAYKTSNYCSVININGGSYSSDGWLFNTDDGCNIKVFGGTFSENPEDYLAEGCNSLRNPDGTYTVTAK